CATRSGAFSLAKVTGERVIATARAIRLRVFCMEGSLVRSRSVKVAAVAAVASELGESFFAENCAQRVMHGRPHAHGVAADIDGRSVMHPLAQGVSALAETVLHVLAGFVA